MKKRVKDNYYTFMIVPHDSVRPVFNICIPKFAIRLFILLFVISSIALTASIIYSSILSGRLVNYWSIVTRSKQNEKKIDNYVFQTNKIKEELQEILDNNNELRKLLGLKIEKKNCSAKSSIQALSYHI